MMAKKSVSEQAFDHKKFRVAEGDKVRLAKIATKSSVDEAATSLLSQEDVAASLESDLVRLQALQERLYAESRQSLLVILQGMDASGKDGTVRNVMRGINPQGCRVQSFRAPAGEDLQHHFLWRPMRFLPERGMISIFNRSYYEEVIVVRLHPEFLEPQRILPYKKLSQLWPQRYEQIRTFEDVLVSQGTRVIKFFLHISKEEQKNRLIARLDDPDKHWKFNDKDLAERERWDDYQNAFQDAIEATTTKQAPWYIIPADEKWYARAVVADIIAHHLDAMNPKFPTVSAEQQTHYSQIAEELRSATT